MRRLREALAGARWERWLWLLPLLAVAVWLVAHRDLPWRLWGGDEMEYADVARRLARGDGFSASVIYPAEILDYGASRDHPSVVRAPLWPIALGAAFAVAGPEEWAVHVVLLALFVALVGAATATGHALAGPVAGAVAGLATATCPPTLVLSLLGGTETLYALCATALFLLMARGTRGLWLGVACGLAYLTRYNGMVLLPAAILWLLLSRAPRRDLLECVGGFALVALPWWVRNVVVTGDPFFTYYRWAVWVSPFERSYTTTLLHMLEPSPSAPTAMDPVEKVKLLLPTMFLRSPFASANLAALAGVALACVRRDRISWVFVALAVATTVGLSLAVPRGRYFAPFFPLLLVLGVAGWQRFGGRLRAPALALLLAAPLLPAFPPEAPDLWFMRQLVLGPRDESAVQQEPDLPWARCIDADDLVVGENASAIGWVTDATTIWLPSTADDFWRVVDAYPVRFAWVKRRKDVLDARFEERFAPRPDCGDALYEIRGDG